jgi:2-isopropylmalate synthase
MPYAFVKLNIDGEEKSMTTATSGSVDATFSAINQLLNMQVNLQLYSVSNVTQGTDALGEVSVRLEHEGRIINGQGTDTDIISASAKAYIHALNKVLAATNRAHPQI